MGRIGRRWLWQGGLIALSLLNTATAWAAADEERLPPYDVSGLEHHKIWVPWIFAFLFAVACVLVGIKNPRRTHLD